jgi:hypothetical protein
MMNETILIVFSMAVIIGVLIIIIFMLLGKTGIGLEKLYPLILLIFFVFLIPLIIKNKISESTFATFLGVIIGAFVTAFRDLIEKVLSKKD